MKNTLKRYYSKLRPVMPGCFPKKEAVERIVNFDTKLYCVEIGMEAWGFIEYREALTKEEADAYELTLGYMKTFYCVTTSVDDRGKVKAAITNYIDTDHRPENSFVSLARKDIYNDWFESYEEAERFVEEAKMA